MRIPGGLSPGVPWSDLGRTRIPVPSALRLNRDGERLKQAGWLGGSGSPPGERGGSRAATAGPRTGCALHSPGGTAAQVTEQGELWSCQGRAVGRGGADTGGRGIWPTAGLSLTAEGAILYYFARVGAPWEEQVKNQQGGTERHAHPILSEEDEVTVLPDISREAGAYE